MDDKVYVAFGDASTGSACAVYGLVLLPRESVDDVCAAVQQIKIKYGGDASSSLHCREMTSGRARSESCWSHLNPGDVVDLLSDVLSALAPFQPILAAGVMRAECYPTSFRLLGRNGHSDITHPINDKWRELWVFKHLAMMLRPSALIPVTQAPTLACKPWWRVRGEIIEPGYTVSDVYLEREKTKASWFSKQFQWGVLASDLSVRGAFGESHRPIRLAEVDVKHPLLDVADIFAWHICRAVGGNALPIRTPPHDIQTVMIESYKGEIVLGGAEEIEAMEQAFRMGETEPPPPPATH